MEVVDCKTCIRTIIDDIVDKNSLDMVGDDEYVKVLRATTNSNKDARPLEW